jgi:uncharacterized protein YbjT (DUF2867 family)
VRIAIIGATGLVGRALSSQLLLGGHEIHALVRRASGRSDPRWHEHVSSPDAWPELVRELRPEVAISTLGTTMRAAGSEAAFRAVDHDMVVRFAAAARDAGAGHMLVVSSVGAKQGSPSFYLALKAEMEEALSELRLDRLDIFRPGLLRGERGEDRRLGERIGIIVSPLTNLLLRGSLDRYAAIDADVVAAAIAAAAGETGPGVYIHDNRAIHRVARR